MVTTANDVSTAHTASFFGYFYEDEINYHKCCWYLSYWILFIMWRTEVFLCVLFVRRVQRLLSTALGVASAPSVISRSTVQDWFMIILTFNSCILSFHLVVWTQPRCLAKASCVCSIIISLHSGLTSISMSLIGMSVPSVFSCLQRSYVDYAFQRFQHRRLHARRQSYVLWYTHALSHNGGPLFRGFIAVFRFLANVGYFCLLHHILTVSGAHTWVLGSFPWITADHPPPYGAKQECVEFYLHSPACCHDMLIQ